MVRDRTYHGLSQTVNGLKDGNTVNPYPHKFHVSTSFSTFHEKVSC